jgi:hypothetical protein
VLTSVARECLQLRKADRQWNLRQVTKGNMDLGLSVQFCGVITDRNGRHYKLQSEWTKNDTENLKDYCVQGSEKLSYVTECQSNL